VDGAGGAALLWARGAAAGAGAGAGEAFLLGGRVEVVEIGAECDEGGYWGEVKGAYVVKEGLGSGRPRTLYPESNGVGDSRL
jgi:hypothetical protein